MMTDRGKCLLAIALHFVSLMLFVSVEAARADSASDFGWPQLTPENRRCTYWWWLGSAVTEQGLTEHLDAYHKVGLGGFI